MVLLRVASSSANVASAVANNVAALVTTGGKASGSRTSEQRHNPVRPPFRFSSADIGKSSPFSGSRRNFSSSSRADASIKDPYATLGVKRESNAKDIKSAYYTLAKKFHPDTSKEKGAKERFVEIQSAYDILSDDKKKAAFDQYGTTDGSPGFDPFGGGGGGFGGFGGGSGGGFQGFGGGGGNASDIFEGLFGAFGGRGRTSGPGFAGESRGEDLETTIQISFEEACRGTKKGVTIAPVERCSPCEGQGLKKGAKRKTCGVCNGTGTRTFVIQSGFQMASTCPACNGAGQSVAPGDECSSCEGVGRVRSRKTIEVKVPPGVDDGAKIRMEGQGDVPLQGSGTAGSLYVRIGVRPSKIWRRQGSNLYFPATVPFHTAILGGKVRVPTLDGNVDVRVPSGTQVGDEMLLRGRGVPNLMRRGDKGDLLVQFEVTIPRSLTKRQKEILQQYVDDVEGRRPAAPATAPPPNPPPSASQPSPSPSPAERQTQSPPPSPPPPSAPSPSAETLHTDATQTESSTKASEPDPNEEAKQADGEYDKQEHPRKGIFHSLWNWLRSNKKE
ncbi:hypothetical protein CBS101457_004702 [Exobasidium rhododendri]|nr:hypothetical protein CBS101457_004702 [Exobasidium rhododendri]